MVDEKKAGDGAPTPSQKQRRRSTSGLRPFPPGVSGNPGGAPRGRRLSTAYRDVLDLSPREARRRLREEDAETMADLIGLAVAAKAAKGGIYAAQELGDRTEGKPGVAPAGGLSMVSLILSLPSRDLPQAELADAFEASAADLKTRLLREAGLDEPLPVVEAEMVEAAGTAEEAPPVEVDAPVTHKR